MIPPHMAVDLTAIASVVFEHVGRATFPTSVYSVRPCGKVVICAGTTGLNQCLKADEPIASGAVRPVLWRTLGFDGVGEAHQLMKDDKHLGKIAVRAEVGA